MSVTVGIINSTSNLLPVALPINITAYGGSSMATNIQKAQINIYRIGQGAPEVSYIQGPDPKLTSTFGTPIMNFDIHEVLRDMVTFPLPPASSLLLDGSSSLVNFKVGVIGYYMDSSANWQSYSEVFLPTSAPYLYGINSILEPWQDASAILDYIIPVTTGSANDRFLTNAPDKKMIGLYESEFLAGYSSHNFADMALVVQQGVLGIDTLSHFGMRIFPINGLTDVVHYFVGIGPGNLDSQQYHLADTSANAYSVWLTELGTNLFTDGSNGTMESNVDGLVGPDNLPVAHSTAHSYLGTHSAMIDGGVATAGLFNTYLLMSNTSAVTLVANTDYYLSAYVYLEAGSGFVMPDNLTIHWNLTPGSFTDADFAATNSLRLSEGEIFNQWLPIIFRLSTDTVSLAGTFEIIAVMDGSTALNGLSMYIDHITLQEAHQKTETRTYILDKNCHAAPTRIHFINKLGGMDSFTFIATEVKKLSVDHTQFEKYRDYQSTITDRGRKVQAVTAQETIECNTGALTSEEALWLEELLISPEVYIQRNGDYVPVIVQAGEFITNNEETNGISLTVNLQLANNVVVQRG